MSYENIKVSQVENNLLIFQDAAAFEKMNVVMNNVKRV